MSMKKVHAFFSTYGREKDILEFSVSSATVELAAQAVGCAPARIAKTLSFAVEGGCILVVCAGDAKIDNAKFKAQFNTKATMLDPEQVKAMTGHSIGGVCPFALPDRAPVTTWLDVSLKRFDTVVPAAGSDHSAIELNLADLEWFSKAKGWVDVCKDWE